MFKKITGCKHITFCYQIHRTKNCATHNQAIDITFQSFFCPQNGTIFRLLSGNLRLEIEQKFPIITESQYAIQSSESILTASKEDGFWSQVFP